MSHVEELTTDGFLNLYVFAGHILCRLDTLLHEHLQKLLECKNYKSVLEETMKAL